MSLIRTILPLAAAAVAFSGGAHAAEVTPADSAQFFSLAAMAFAGFSFSVRNRKG
ncbi:MAG: hypothetical protein AAB227_08845 [Pseudomonadota bacterium]|mgnify:CR=1 FL=1